MAGRQNKKRGLSPIGIDIGPSEIRAIQLLGDAEFSDVVREAVFPRFLADEPDAPFDTDDARHLAGVLSRRGFVGDRVAICAPSGSTASHVITLPPRDSGAPVGTIATAELARVRRAAPDSFEVAAWYMPTRGRSEQGMAVACDRAMIDDRVNVLESAGLTTLAIDLEETALTRACAEDLLGTEESINAIVRVGWNASLGVLTLGDSVVYARRVEFGVSDFVQDFRDRSGLPLAEASRLLTLGDHSASDNDSVFANAARIGWKRLATEVAREIDTAVTYVSHAYRSATIGRVIVAGYGTWRPELADTLDATLGMQVVIPRWPGSEAGSRVAVAMGLARRFDA